MKKKNLKKLLLAVCCAALLVCVSIGATVAYLTSKGTVTNTFTVGKVAITLDEAKVSTDGTAVTPAERITTGNGYKLMPGRSYTKDPIVHVDSQSESCWVFVKVENGIAAIEDSANTIASQIVKNGWQQLKNAEGNVVDNVYYKADTVAAGSNLKVFESFKVADDVSNDTLADYGNKTIVVTAYAIQADGFDNAYTAWTKVNGI